MKKIVFVLLIVTTGTVSALACPDCVKNNHAAEPIVNEKLEHYDVSGNCEKDLQHQMKHKGIEWLDGQRYDSLTIWNMMWDYGYAQTPHGCICDSFTVKLNITTRYPRLIHTENISQGLIDQWDAYMKNLTIHETGHRDLAVKEASQLSRAVSQLHPATTCAELDKAVHDLCRQRINKLKDDQNEYDVVTNHGLTQRAIFPPHAGLTPE